MTIDVEYNIDAQASFFLHGGLLKQSTASANEAFLQSFLESPAYCGIRHSYIISTLDLGIQGVTIADTKIWAVGLSSGDPSIGLTDTTNVLIRTTKADPSESPEFFRVDFVGGVAGSSAASQTVLKMINFGDSQIAMQSLQEVRLVNFELNKVRGYYTFDQGDVFE